MNSSRVNKYRDLRAGLKDEAGINRENIEDTIDIIDDIEDDDFLATINRSFKQEEKDLPDINDTSKSNIHFRRNLSISFNT